MATIQVRVTPNSRRSALTRDEAGLLHLRIAAPAVEGKANEALCSWLAEKLGTRTKYVSVVRGATSRTKVIDIDDAAGIDLEQRISAILQN